MSFEPAPYRSQGKNEPSSPFQGSDTLRENTKRPDASPATPRETSEAFYERKTADAIRLRQQVADVRLEQSKVTSEILELDQTLKTFANRPDLAEAAQAKIASFIVRMTNLERLAGALLSQSNRAFEFAQPIEAQTRQLASIERWKYEAIQLAQDQAEEEKTQRAMEQEIHTSTAAAEALRAEMVLEHPSVMQSSQTLEVLHQQQEAAENYLLIASKGPKTEQIQNIEQQYKLISSDIAKHSQIVQAYQTKLDRWNTLASRVNQATSAGEQARLNSLALNEKSRLVQEAIQKAQQDAGLVERGMESVMRLERSEQPQARSN